MTEAYRITMRKSKTLWSDTPAGHAAYVTARAEAQAKCNADGYDRGIEPNNLFRSWHVFMVPQKRNRSGHELTCEIVSCEVLDRCQIGHGPQ